ncbi:MAG: SCP2 sterol-binding domain-containing protein [Candidatus Eisenbacteria bacterium]
MSPTKTSIADLFDTRIPAGLRQFPEQARAVNAVYAFKIAGEGGGDWTCDLTANQPSCVRGSSVPAQCTFECDAADFARVLQDPNEAMSLYFRGKLKVSGDSMLAMKLQELFKLAQAR